MKNLTLISALLMALLSPTAGAISVGGLELAALANSVTASNGSFLNYNSATAADTISFSQLTADLTDSSAATYVLSLDSGSYIDMGFSGSNAIYNGVGADLALFFAGDFNPAIVDVVSVQINGVTNSYNTVFTPVQWTVSDSFRDYNLTVALIELDDFGLAGSIDALANFRIGMGHSTRPALSLVGGFHTEPVVIPLPLPALLLASGLGVLGLFRRRPQL